MIKELYEYEDALELFLFLGPCLHTILLLLEQGCSGMDGIFATPKPTDSARGKNENFT